MSAEDSLTPSLREASDAQLAAIIESSDDAIVSKTLDGVIRTWNAGARRIFGWTAEEVIGKPITILIPPDRKDEEPKILSRLQAGQRVDHFETVRMHKDGHPIDISVTISPIRDRTGRVIGASKIARDVTEQKRLQREVETAKEAAETASRAKDVFLSIVSHELRTPLTPVLAALSFLESRGDLPAELRAELAMIRNNIETEARLVDDLLDLTRITRGTLQLNRERVDAHGSLRNAISMLRPTIEAKPLNLSLALEAAEHHVEADPGRLQQIFFNVLSNAVRYTPAGGSVTVRSANLGQSLGVNITDGGPGIPAEMLEEIFEPFNTFAAQERQLGLGLSLTRSLVELHGGTIAAASPGAGRGATLTVELPTAGPSRPASTTMSDHAHILLVEDHADTRNVMARLLGSFGFTVHTAGTIAEAVKLADEHPFDLLISDIGLPDGSGNEIMQHVRRKSPGVKGIALSGFGQADDLRRSEEAGFEAHLVKPINFQTLRDMLQNLQR